MSYSINEALSYGVRIICTKLPYLEEIGIRNHEEAIILNFNCNNIEEVAEELQTIKKINWKPPEDNYMKYLVESKSTYEERKLTMKKIRVKQKFLDMKHGNCLRKAGEEFIEENSRAEDLINRGFAILVEDIKEKEVKVEKAVKEEKKERAVKETTKKGKPTSASKEK